jgi:hypothetical protein
MTNVVIRPSIRTRAFAELCAVIENVGGSGVDGAGIAGLYIAPRIARFDGRAYAVTDRAFLERDAVLHVQTIVARVDANIPTTGDNR